LLTKPHTIHQKLLRKQRLRRLASALT
jgi:hypothetical protein